jgi:hypothetical protein
MYKGKLLWAGLVALFVFTLGLNASIVLAFDCKKLVGGCKALVAKAEKRGNTDKMTVAEAKKGCEKALELHKAKKHKESIIEAGLAISMVGSSVK